MAQNPPGPTNIKAITYIVLSTVQRCAGTLVGFSLQRAKSPQMTSLRKKTRVRSCVIARGINKELATDVCGDTIRGYTGSLEGLQRLSKLGVDEIDVTPTHPCHGACLLSLPFEISFCKPRGKVARP